MIMGFLQTFTYAEMAGMFGNKSGGASVYGATAWLRYSKFIAPLSVWCNWFAWSPRIVARLRHCGGLHPQCAVPDSAADSQRCWIGSPANGILCDNGVVDYMAANAGMAAADAIKAVLADGVAALTPAIPHLGSSWPSNSRSWHVAFQFDLPHRRHFDVAHLLDPASRHCANCKLHKSGWRSSCWYRLLLVGLVPILTGAINSMNVTGLVPPTAAYSALMARGTLAAGRCFLVASTSRLGQPTALKRPFAIRAN